MSSRSKRRLPSRAQSKPSTATTAMPKRRRWVFRLAAIILAPTLFFSVLEIGLRVAGVGHSVSFFLPLKIEGKDCLVENERYGWLFFGEEMARAPFPFVIQRAKPPETIRIFVLGESAAYGDPQPAFGLSRM